MAQTAFAIICVTAPTSGAVASGPLTKCAGGYESKNALKLGLGLAILCGAVAFPLPFLDNFYLICTDLWFYLFMGGMIVPLMTGCYLANVEEEYRTTASALANIFYFAFGCAPAPYIWGVVQKATGGKMSRWGLITTLLVNIPPIILMIIAVAYQSYKEEEAEITEQEMSMQMS